MQVVIDIPEAPLYRDIYTAICENGYIYDEDNEYVAEIIKNGVLLPKGATNGDMIKAMFPNAKIERGLYGIDGIPLICLNLGTRHDVYEMSFVEDWWNAPYKGEIEKNAGSN